MKRLLMFILMLTVIASISFAGDFSGETRVDAVFNVETETTVYAIDTGAVYETGFLTFGADVYYDTEEDLDFGLPVTATFGNLILKAEPGFDNVLSEDGTIYVFDGDITYSIGVLALSYGFGYGSDEVLDMSAAVSITDLIPGVVINAEWIDADDLNEDVFGDVEVGVTVKY